MTLPAAAPEAKVIEVEGRVIIAKPPAAPRPAQPHVPLVAKDQLATGEASRAVLQMSARWMARIDEETDIEIAPNALTAEGRDAVSLSLGGVFVYSREENSEIKIITPSATGGLRGTQLVARVFPDGRTTMQVIEGEVDLANPQGQVLLRAGEAGEALPGQAPRKTAVIQANQALQWALYYPAVLSEQEFAFSDADRRSLERSIEAYRRGNLLEALARLPAPQPDDTDASRLYRAAVLLATGRVDASRELLAGLPELTAARQALERLIAAVLRTDLPDLTDPSTCGLAIAESYYQQSRRNLVGAREAARRATQLDPAAGFAWTRLAELEFSFDRAGAADLALAKAITLTPDNAQAHALKGFVLAAANQPERATSAFITATQLDGGLGNGWLGLGLMHLRRGELAAGIAHLQTAATVEPTRAFLYSYHGKALGAAGLDKLAEKDLTLARQLDPGDPTAWLYSALLSVQQGRNNAAIAATRESIRLNNNRSVYRSRFLLDQDRAVRGANLATMYARNGMEGVALREASRAVESDYASASAHLFLANSFDAFRDPKRLLLRYETAWFNELLLANLLAPVGGGPLSQFVSQQEYSKLFEADGVGGNVVAEVRERGFVDFVGSLYSTRGNFSTGVDVHYFSDEGSRANNDSRRKEVYWQAKYQPGPDDILYGLVKWEDLRGGDAYQSVDNMSAFPGLRYHEKQQPGLALAGWNHRWAPGFHTLALVGRLAANHEQSVPEAQFRLLVRDTASLVPGFLQLRPTGGLEYTDPVLRAATTPPVTRNADGSLNFSPDFLRAITPFLGNGTAALLTTDRFSYTTDWGFKVLSAELQQLWQTDRQTLVVGGRIQGGDFDTRATLSASDPANRPLYAGPAANQNQSVPFTRTSAYVYDTFRLLPSLSVIGGLSYDDIRRPDNFRQPPVNPERVRRSRANAKAGLTFSPSRWFTLRGVYSEALGGVSYDESVRLEPVQLAGFNQAFRSIISESLIGSAEAPLYRNAGLSLEGSLPSKTWWTLSFNRLREEVDRTIGSFDFFLWSIAPWSVLPAGTSEEIRYREDTWAAGVDQLVGEEWSLGATFSRTDSRLRQVTPLIPTRVLPDSDRRTQGTLDEVTTRVVWNSPHGWFTRLDGTWRRQHATVQPVTVDHRESFWQWDLRAGWRFHRNQREISVGVLNLTDTDYQLHPISYLGDLPRDRTITVRCRMGF